MLQKINAEADQVEPQLKQIMDAVASEGKAVGGMRSRPPTAVSSLAPGPLARTVPRRRETARVRRLACAPRGTEGRARPPRRANAGFAQLKTLYFTTRLRRAALVGILLMVAQQLSGINAVM